MGEGERGELADTSASHAFSEGKGGNAMLKKKKEKGGNLKNARTSGSYAARKKGGGGKRLRASYLEKKKKKGSAQEGIARMRFTCWEKGGKRTCVHKKENERVASVSAKRGGKKRGRPFLAIVRKGGREREKGGPRSKGQLSLFIAGKKEGGACNAARREKGKKEGEGLVAKQDWQQAEGSRERKGKRLWAKKKKGGTRFGKRGGWHQVSTTREKKGGGHLDVSRRGEKEKKKGGRMTRKSTVDGQRSAGEYKKKKKGRIMRGGEKKKKKNTVPS